MPEQGTSEKATEWGIETEGLPFNHVILGLNKGKFDLQAFIEEVEQLPYDPRVRPVSKIQFLMVRDPEVKIPVVIIFREELHVWALTALEGLNTDLEILCAGLFFPGLKYFMGYSRALSKTGRLRKSISDQNMNKLDKVLDGSGLSADPLLWA